MPKMIVKRKAEVISEFDLSSSQASFTIGSEHTNDIVVEDRLVSMTHACIERNESRYFLKDLQSAFGTYVNGEKVEDLAELKNGDNIQVGEHAILFDNPLENLEFSFLGEQIENRTKKRSNDDPAETAEKNRRDDLESKIRKESITLLRQGTLGDSGTIPYQLVTIYGPYAGRKYQLRQPETKIGRDENLNDIVLDKNKKGEPDQSISRRHATIVYKDGTFFVSDKRSKTRTYVNREVVPTDGEVELFVNDEIEVVSDQQSSIFRLVEEGAENFKPPKKAGVWWVRYQSKFAGTLMLLLALTGAFFAITGFQERSMLTQRPEPLSLDVSYWSTDKGTSLENDFIQSGGEKIFSLVPTVSDFNGDGIIDIITTNVTDKPLLIDGQTKQPRWLIDTIPASPKSALRSADINQNGLNDLIYIAADGRLVAIDGQYGAEIWLSPFFNSELTGPPVVDDFNGDNLNDVAVADKAGNIHIGYNQVLNMEWAVISTGIPITSPLTSGDLDKDGDSELVCGSERGIVFILDGENREIFGTIDVNEELNRALGSLYEDNQIRYPVGIADLNGDDHDDLVITSVQGRIIAIDGSKRERLWHDVLSNELTLKTEHSFPFALGDFDSDGIYDVVTGSEKGEIRAYSGRGHRQKAKILWQILPKNSAAVYQSFAIGDINKDRVSDVIYTDDASLLWVLDGRNGENLLAAGQPTTSQASMPLAADLENDGFLDIFLATQSGIVLQYKTNSQVPKGSIVWGQQFGQNQNTVRPAFEMPETTTANVSMLLGIILFLGSGAASFIISKRRPS